MSLVTSAPDASGVGNAASQRPAARWLAVLDGGHLPALDGLRAIAVLLVILGHLELPFISPDLGVCIFFVLSGFLITHLLIKEADANGAVSLKRFYARRALRIFPAYYAYLMFTFVLDTALGDLRWIGLVAPALTYTVNYYNALHGHPVTSVAHLWSLSLEEQFYLFWPGIFVLLAPRGRRALATFLLASISAVLCYRSFAWFGLHTGTAYVYNAFETRFDNLAVGCLIAVGARTALMRQWIDTGAARWWLPLPVIAALSFVRFHTSEGFHYGPGFTLEALLIGAIILQCVVLSSAGPWSALNIPFVRYIGRLSYSLYLYHGWGIALGGKLVRTWGPWQVMADLACCLLLAAFSYHVIEQPFLRLKARVGAAKESATLRPTGSGPTAPVP